MGGPSQPDSLVLTQVKLLCCVGMMYSGDRRLMAISKSYHSDLTSFCDAEWTRLSSEMQSSPGSSASEQINMDWLVWIRAESSRRTGYCIWVGHSTHYYESLLTPPASRFHVGISFSDASIVVSWGCQSPHSMSGSPMGSRISP
jgi:hypothetical protein